MKNLFQALLDVRFFSAGKTIQRACSYWTYISLIFFGPGSGFSTRMKNSEVKFFFHACHGVQCLSHTIPDSFIQIEIFDIATSDQSMAVSYIFKYIQISILQYILILHWNLWQHEISALCAIAFEDSKKRNKIVKFFVSFLLSNRSFRWYYFCIKNKIKYA